MAFADGVADFRSDTVTRPTAEMLAAMASAEVGDDVYGDDPTVNALEEESAEVVGKQAGVFVPTGTMGNQLSIMYHTSPGEEILADQGTHSRSVERGGPQALSGVAFRTTSGEGGRITPEDVEEAMELAGFFPRISLMIWENTHNLSGGRVIPLDLMTETSSAARRHGLSVHIDGARIFNAVAATGVPAHRYAETGNTIQFCFSKGLGAPIGSVVCGDGDTIDEIRYLRKRLGGGMRQVGVIAAAARIALRDRQRLVEDHVLAGKLATRMAELFPGSVEPADVETNIVNVAFEKVGLAWDEVAGRMRDDRILVNAPFGNWWRLVTHRDVDDSDVDRLLEALR